MIDQAGTSLRSVKAIVETLEQQNAAMSRIDAGVDEMKSAADKIAHGFDEQVKANREFDRSLSAREDQIQAIFEATRFQMETVENIFAHFSRSEERLYGNAEKARGIIEEINELERLAENLRQLSLCFQGEVAETDAPVEVQETSIAEKKPEEAIIEDSSDEDAAMGIFISEESVEAEAEEKEE